MQPNISFPDFSKKKLSLFAICTVLPCLFFYSCIISSGSGVHGGSVLALMWLPRSAIGYAVIAFLIYKHSKAP